MWKRVIIGEAIVFDTLSCALADCGDNIRLFSVLLYKIGYYENHTEKLGRFRWHQFFNNLQNLSSDVQYVASWMPSTVDFAKGNFSRYLYSLLQLDSKQLLRIMTPALLGHPTVENLRTEITGTGRSWEQL
jgi:hypothetical protein